jgi:hypothetical protein
MLSGAGVNRQLLAERGSRYRARKRSSKSTVGLVRAERPLPNGLSASNRPIGDTHCPDLIAVKQSLVRALRDLLALAGASAVPAGTAAA